VRGCAGVMVMLMVYPYAAAWRATMAS
jgi:hypothetical protein